MRVAPEIVLTNEEHAELTKLVRSKLSSVLACATCAHREGITLSSYTYPYSMNQAGLTLELCRRLGR